MTITVKNEMNFDDLVKNTWCCEDTLNLISENNMEDEFVELLNEVMTEPTQTELNDFIRFESDYIFEQLGIEVDE